MALDLAEFLQGYKTHEVVLGEKKRIFRETSIKALLKIKDKEWAEQLIHEILLRGKPWRTRWNLESNDTRKKRGIFPSLI